MWRTQARGVESVKNLKINYGSADDLAGTAPADFTRQLAPGKSGPDVFSIIPVRPGLCMYAVRIDPGQMPEYEFEIEKAPLQFGYCLSGRTHTKYNGKTECTKAEFINRAGTNSICRMSGTSGVSRLLSKDAFNSIAIQIDPQILTGYLASDMGNIPEQCRRVLLGEFPICGLAMTSSMLRVANQVFTCVFKKSARQLFMEAKALELLSLQVDLLTRTLGVSRERTLTADEQERIRFAAEIMIRDMQDPPTITVLSRKVGINEFKLKKGFKQVFGTTMLKFIQQHRMACARDMIVNQGANVSQAADFVGYVNIGHFIACYKREFGTTPGNHKRGTIYTDPEY